MATKKKTAKKSTKKSTKASASAPNLSPVQVGNNVYIRTVTYHYTGRIVQLSDAEIVLDDAAWIADSGRFTQAMAHGTLSEVEPYPGGVHVSISRGADVDVSSWLHDLPRAQK